MSGVSLWCVSLPHFAVTRKKFLDFCETFLDSGIVPTETYDLAVSEAAEILGVHPDTLRRWTDDGKVAVWVTPGGQRRYRRSDLDALRPAAPAPSSEGEAP